MGKLIKVPMLKILIFIFCFFSNTHYKESIDVDSAFIMWNKVTIASLQQQSTSDERKDVKKNYKNRLAAFYAYIDIKGSGQLNKVSVRYRFLELVKNKLEAKDVFVVETTTSGEEVNIRNVALYPTDSSKTDVETYLYTLDGWRKDATFKDYSLLVDATSLNLRVKWAKGINNDDVTISHFQKGKIKSSEFYLFGTLLSQTAAKVIAIR